MADNSFMRADDGAGAWDIQVLCLNGKAYSTVYLKTLHNQLSAIFNHAVKYYNLTMNPATKVANMGKAKNKGMLFWAKDEYAKFAGAMMDKPISFYAFEMLYCVAFERAISGRVIRAP